MTPLNTDPFIRELLLRTTIELYELTPEIQEYDSSSDVLVTRESQLPKLREALEALAPTK